MLTARAAGARRRLLGYAGAQPQQRVERLMGDYFRHARIVSRSLDWIAPGRADAGRRRTWSRSARRHPLRRRRRGAAREPHTLAAAVSGGDRRRAVACRGRSAAPASSSTSTATRAEDFFPTIAERDRAARVPEAAGGPVRAAVGDARLRAARADVSRVPGDLLPRRARLLPQVHGRRAHAAHDPESRAARDAPTTPSRERFRLAARRPRPAPELLVLALLFHDVGKWRDDDHASPKACGWRGRCSIGSQLPAGVTRDGRVPDSTTTCGCRWSRSAATPRIPRSSAVRRTWSASKSG